MPDDRSAAIRVGDSEFRLMLTTRATKEIAQRYGGIEKLGDKLLKTENFEMALDEIVWLITLLANQEIMAHNLKHKEQPKDLLTTEEVELLTSPFELAAYKDAIMAAMYNGTRREIVSGDGSQDQSKNSKAG